MHDQNGLPERLKAARNALGYTQSRIAEAVGSKLRSWQEYEKGSRTPGSQVIAGLSRLGLNANWLLTGDGSMFLNDVVREDPATYGVVMDGKRPSPEGYALIPRYNVRASAGHGALVDNEHVIDVIAFNRDWLRHELGANEDDLYLLEVDGESMEPTLRPGDTILIDTRPTSRSPRDGIYVVRIDDTLLVKRLQRLPGRILVSSDNPAYQSFEVSLNAHDAPTIIGRVIWAGRRM